MSSKTHRQALITGCLLAGLIGVTGLIFRAEIRDNLNAYRASRLMEKAEAAFNDEDWANAARTGTAAHYLDPDNAQIDLLVARSLLKQRNPSSVAWWKRALSQPKLPPEELRIITYAILKQGDVQEGLPFLNRLMELDGENPETQRLWLYALGLQRRLGSAQNYMEQMDLQKTEAPPEVSQASTPTLEESGTEDELPAPLELSLSVAVETANASETEALASTLSREGEWLLLQKLMINRLREEPENPEYKVKLLGAYYYAGDPTPMPPLLEQLQEESLESQPVWESFLYYLHLLSDGFNPETHQQLEALLARYPEVLEYRVVLALSFFLKGDTGLANNLVGSISDMPIATARHLRVAAIILGQPDEALLLPGERDQLLPRERFLMSQVSPQ